MSTISTKNSPISRIFFKLIVRTPLWCSWNVKRIVNGMIFNYQVSLSVNICVLGGMLLCLCYPNADKNAVLACTRGFLNLKTPGR